MGLGLPHSVLVSPQLFVVRAMDLRSGMERFYQRFYLNMDRERFDRWLVSLLPPSVDLRTGTVLAGCGDDAGQRYELTLHAGGRSYVERARVLVGADGASSAVRRRGFAEHRVPSYLAIQEWFRADRALPYYTAIFDPAVTDFHAWTIPKDEFLLVGAAVPLSRARERFQLLKEKLVARGFDLGEPIKREACMLLRPRRPRHLALGRGNLALVGEAAGWISPSSAEGLSYGMRSAQALAAAMAPGLDGAVSRYRRATRGLGANVMAKDAKSLVMYHSALRRLVMASGMMSVGGARERPM
jgi:flavin-dependent dehydrogenase